MNKIKMWMSFNKENIIKMLRLIGIQITLRSRFEKKYQNFLIKPKTG